MIKSVYTSNVVYHSASEAEEYKDQISICDCTFTKTEYGSVIIERKNVHTIEMYPSRIQHIVYQK